MCYFLVRNYLHLHPCIIFYKGKQMIQFSCFCLIGNYAYPTLAYNIESRFKGDTFPVFSCENSNMFLYFDFIVILEPHKKRYVLRRGFASLWLEKGHF